MNVLHKIGLKTGIFEEKGRFLTAITIGPPKKEVFYVTVY